ncbi:hypothetical protein EVAR_79154_1 [Eumeta japonica]|uniref:Uncharacterized protein n=1 Tax=Eumeta variegata TaxID=151549 RepID=A0A4C1UT33_EUMVA|nr:hypothetical protein EVAR_79154_1 [Eumeta japonica]
MKCHAHTALCLRQPRPRQPRAPHQLIDTRYVDMSRGLGSVGVSFQEYVNNVESVLQLCGRFGGIFSPLIDYDLREGRLFTATLLLCDPYRLTKEDLSSDSDKLRHRYDHGEATHPCLTPLRMSNQSLCPVYSNTGLRQISRELSVYVTAYRGAGRRARARPAGGRCRNASARRPYVTGGKYSQFRVRTAVHRPRARWQLMGSMHSIRLLFEIFRFSFERLTRRCSVIESSNGVVIGPGARCNLVGGPTLWWRLPLTLRQYDSECTRLCLSRILMLFLSQYIDGGSHQTQKLSS